MASAVYRARIFKAVLKFIQPNYGAGTFTRQLWNIDIQIFRLELHNALADENNPERGPRLCHKSVTLRQRHWGGSHGTGTHVQKQDAVKCFYLEIKFNGERLERLGRPAFPQNGNYFNLPNAISRFFQPLTCRFSSHPSGAKSVVIFRSI